MASSTLTRPNRTARRSKPRRSRAGRSGRLWTVLAVVAVVAAAGAYRTAVADHETILLVGDSLVTQARPLLDKTFKADHEKLDASVFPGTDMSWAADQLRTGLKKNPDVVILGTGTNNQSFGWDDNDIKAMNDLLALSDSAKCLVWVMPSRINFPGGSPKPSAFAATLIDQIAGAAGQHPHLHVARWDQVAQTHPEWYQPDGLHYTGNAAFVSFIADSTKQACG
jgi:hypothetical protein